MSNNDATEKKKSWSQTIDTSPSGGGRTLQANRGGLGISGKDDPIPETVKVRAITRQDTRPPPRVSFERCKSIDFTVSSSKTHKETICRGSRFCHIIYGLRLCLRPKNRTLNNFILLYQSRSEDYLKVSLLSMGTQKMF